MQPATSQEVREVAHMKRIISVLTVLAIMAAMLAVSAGPVFAEPPLNLGHCHKGLNSGVIGIGADTNSEINQIANPPTSQGNQPGFPASCRIS
jgi:hypothetical protein